MAGVVSIFAFRRIIHDFFVDGKQKIMFFEGLLDTGTIAASPGYRTRRTLPGNASLRMGQVHPHPSL